MSLMHSSRPHDRNCQRLERTSSSRAEVQGSARPFAVAFAQAGAKSVAIVGRRLDRLETAAEAIKAAAGPSTQVFLETGDVTKRESVETARRDIVNKVGRIDIFVANAGVLPREAPVVGYDEADLRYSLETNVLGPFNSLQAFRRWAAPGAKLFNIGSSIGHWAPLPEVPGAFGYAAAKAAALKMFDYFAFENPDIHVVTVHPGIIATEINPNITVGADTGMVLPPLRLTSAIVLFFPF